MMSFRQPKWAMDVSPSFSQLNKKNQIKKYSENVNIIDKLWEMSKRQSGKATTAS
jgi:hypothetical protein